MSMFDPMLLVDMDEMKQTPADFICHFGWVCLRQQIVISTRAFCAIATVTPFGFIAWQIYECNVTALLQTSLLIV